MDRKTALVTGATGVVGRNLVRYLSGLGDWEVICVSRRKPDVQGRFHHISLDLLDREACVRKLSALTGVTHVFFAAYSEQPTLAEAVAPNMYMLTNVVETVESVAGGLRHIHAVHGTKWYGSHLGPFKTPARESDPRHMPPNFYYDQQDYLIERQRGKAWTWSTVRPHAVCGFSIGSPMNLTTVIAVYAAISRELGLPLAFPGTPGNYRALYQCTDSIHLARAIVWMATEPRCCNEAFNITNGDLIRWENLWPKFADYFGMPLGPPRRINLTKMMADKSAVWDRIVAKHRLNACRFEEIVAWPHGDFVFTPEYDIISDTGKARRYGFHDSVDTEEMFFRLFDEYRQNKVTP
jgi:nucleoside-diphosphate-sugar epimerase